MNENEPTVTVLLKGWGDSTFTLFELDKERERRQKAIHDAEVALRDFERAIPATKAFEALLDKVAELKWPIKSYHVDLEYNDRVATAMYPDRPFIWCVGDCGTHLMFCDGEALYDGYNHFEGVCAIWGQRYKWFVVRPDGEMRAIEIPESEWDQKRLWTEICTEETR